MAYKREGRRLLQVSRFGGLFQPNYDELRIFKCHAYTLIPKDDPRKLEQRSRKYIFLSYELDDKISYRIWDLEHRQIIRSSNVVFNESAMHKTVKQPIKVERVIFSKVSSFMMVQPNTRSTSWVAESSSTDSAPIDLA